MRSVAGPPDDDWNAGSHERWTKRHSEAAVVVAERHQDLILKVPAVAFMIG